MTFAVLNSDLSYWQKQAQPLYPDLIWNIPEQKRDNIAIVGGNSQNFSTPVRIAEYLDNLFPINRVTTFLPDAIRGKLPPLTNINYLPSTTSGSFAKSRQLELALAAADASLIIGDLSKNSATAVALADAVKANLDEPKPLVITRDSLDLLISDANTWLARPQTFVIGSMLQLQKLFQAIYYPRMILLSQPLMPVIETLHKFTLTYPVAITTFHQENIIVAQGGQITTTLIDQTSYSPISLWSGQLAAKTMMLNLYNPGQPLAASTAAILFQ